MYHTYPAMFLKWIHSFFPSENKSYSSVRSEALVVVELLVKKITGTVWVWCMHTSKLVHCVCVEKLVGVECMDT